MSDGMSKVTFLTAGILPVPAVDGGAVEGLVETLLRDNEVSPRYDFSVISIWNDRAVTASKEYRHTEFHFLQPPALIKLVDKLTFSIVKHILHKRNISAYRYIFERLWFIRKTGNLIAAKDFGTLVIENHPSIYLALKMKGNATRYAGRYYYHLHNEFSDLYGCADIARKANAVLSISNYIQDSYTHLLGGLSASQKRILMNCVDYEKYSKTPPTELIISFRQKYGLTINDFLFVFTGRITPEKGVKELLEGFNLAREKMPDAYLLIAGKAFFGSDIRSDYEKEVNELAKEADDRVVFTGFIPHCQMPIVYAASDVCCFPSVWEEPACLSVVEGMASGKPVITTVSGGIPEYAGGDGAILLQRGEGLSERIAEAMVKVYYDKELRGTLACKGRIRAKQFDSRTYLDRFSECIGTEAN